MVPVHSCGDRRALPCFACCGGDEAKYQEEWRTWRLPVEKMAVKSEENGGVPQDSTSRESAAGQPMNPAV